MSKTARKNIGITVFFPCYNDSRSIGKLVNSTFKILNKINKNHEVIVIDDGSSDKSREVLLDLSNQYKKLKLIFHKKNKGYGGALKSGFKKASKDLIFYTDGDGQYDVGELPILLALMTKDIDIVNGIKMSRNDPPHRVFFGHLHRFLMRWMFWLPITDVDCDFRLIRKDVIRKIQLHSNTGAICVELTKKAHRVGAKFREVDVHHYKRRYGNSQFFKIKHITATYKDLAVLWFKLIMVEKFLKLQ